MIWIELAVCAAVIILAGSLLSKHGDVISEKTGLERAWIGVIAFLLSTRKAELGNSDPLYRLRIAFSHLWLSHPPPFLAFL